MEELVQAIQVENEGFSPFCSPSVSCVLRHQKPLFTEILVEGDTGQAPADRLWTSISDSRM